MSAEYRHRTRVEVRFGDLDVFRHVNNAVTVSYVEQGRVTYLRDVLQTDPVDRFPLIVAMVRVDYDAPVFFGETVEIGSRVEWIGGTSLAMTHVLTAGGDAHQVARASTVLVAYDYQTERPIPVPDAWRATFADYEGRSLQRPQGDA